jgi:two-component system chemotaxis sensor kinase CheA
MSRPTSTTLNAQSLLAEIPAHRITLAWDEPGETLGRLFRQEVRLPGVLLESGGQVRGAISRAQYFSAIGRYLGIELYHTRPVSVLFASIARDKHLLRLPGGLPLHEGLARCLARPDATVYEPFLVEQDGRVHMVDFLDLLFANSEVSALRNRQMEDILVTVTEGLLMMDEHFTIQPEYSRALENILGVHGLTGRNLLEVLGGCLTPTLREKAADYFRTLFNPKVIERLIASINPLAQVRAELPGKGARHLRFNFLRSLREGRIHRVLVRVEDATRQVAMAEELKSQERRAEERLELGFQLVRADGQLLADFLASLERELTLAERVFGEGAIESPTPSSRDRLFRTVHGFKGEAGMLQLTSFEKRLHALEDVIPGDSAEALRHGLGELRTLLGEGYNVIQQFRALARIHPGQAPVDVPTVIRPTGILPLVEAMVRDLASKRGLRARFHSYVGEDELPLVYRPLIKDALVQFIRNSISHGIEAPEERAARGKPVEASLQFTIRQQPGGRQWELIYQDDGRGLDLERIRERLRELGWTWSNDEDLRQAIFLAGFSTAPTADQLAGRGVGMDLVKTLVDAVGGFIQVHSDAGVYCAFQIVLPMEAPAAASPPEKEVSYETTHC